VSVGFFVAGLPGAVAGLLAVMTPAFLVLPMMTWLAARSDSPRLRGAIRAVVLSSAGLLASASVPLARDAIQGALTLAIVVVTFVLLSFTRVDSAWVMLGAAAVGLASRVFG
jgi:chromate transporter